MCLFNLPEVKQAFGGRKCGNGYVEEGEECDCGEPEVRGPSRGAYCLLPLPGRRGSLGELRQQNEHAGNGRKTREIAHLVKGLSCSRENLSSKSPRGKAGCGGVCLQSQHQRGRDVQIPETYQPVSLIQRLSPRSPRQRGLSRRRPPPKNKW